LEARLAAARYMATEGVCFEPSGWFLGGRGGGDGEAERRRESYLRKRKGLERKKEDGGICFAGV
jgi:hypothetical protein